MKNTIPPPDQLLSDLLEELENFDNETQSSDDFSRFFDQIIGDLSALHLEIIENDRRRMEEAKAAGIKFYASNLTQAVDFLSFLAVKDPEKFESYKIPAPVADALLRLDKASPTDPIKVWSCKSCGFFAYCVLLKSDADRFSRQCPACGRASE